MGSLIEPLRHVVSANRILAREGVVDAFGHVSIRHPERPDRFLMARSRSPELVTYDDILEFDLGGEPIDPNGPPVYAERFIHAAIFEARPDVNSVVHNHAHELIPFGVTGQKLRPMLHVAARMGDDIPIWDIRDKFGDTNLLVVNIEQGRDLAKALGDNTVALMRGHGCAVAAENIHQSVLTSIYTQINARLQSQAMQMGDVTYLSPGEIEAATVTTKGTLGRDRAWEYLRQRAGCQDI